LKVSYYPGCSLHATGKEYDQSMKAVSRALNIELKEVDDWSCCGASSAHSTNFDLSIALSARNLIAAEKDAMDVMVPCAACYKRLKAWSEQNIRVALRFAIRSIFFTMISELIRWSRKSSSRLQV